MSAKNVCAYAVGDLVWYVSKRGRLKARVSGEPCRYRRLNFSMRVPIEIVSARSVFNRNRLVSPRNLELRSEESET